MNKYTNHTPGPWIVNSEGQITDLQDRTIVPNVHAHNIPNPAYPKGNLHYLAEDDGGEANGRLIAAAPDLLDVARKALRELRSINPGPAGDREGNRALLIAAIAKAEGGAE